MNKHFVIHPDGTKSTRNSANNTYTHAIEVGPLPKASEIARYEAQVNRQQVEKARYVQVLELLNNGVEIMAVANPWGQNEFDFFIKGVKGNSHRDQRIGGTSILTPRGMTADQVDLAREMAIQQYQGYIQGCDHGIELYTNLITKTQAGPDFIGGWGIVTWCGRYDLAQKQLNKWTQPGREVRIVETEMK